ncbi:cupin domain-containing protein [Muriicola marianensis]|uniref:Cupin n=1 Tax=Muriicola marianensis TaxID=1324801 RepID=A0ABQ1R3H4_9FLAO|nr:cupin domain-containing protein [Muriicola marianensis]GGD55048.1 cupin [Muriicola marianensis]
MKIQLEEVQPREIMPGYRGRLVHGEHMTLAYWDVDEGAEVPEHSHVHEQIMHVLQGSFEFTVGGAKQVYQAGELVVIPPHIPHSGKALTACRLMDVFSPVREEYK